MPTIILHTTIKASPEVVFDLSRSVDLHLKASSINKEQAIAGTTSGLMGLGDQVTWKAKHLGFTQYLTSKITAYDRPHSFTDEMIKGIFKSLKHEHYFDPTAGGTLMKDVFEYRAPLGILGRLADVLFLKRYMTTFLNQRNSTIKHAAEMTLE